METTVATAFCIDFAFDGVITPLHRLSVDSYDPDELEWELSEWGVSAPALT